MRAFDTRHDGWLTRSLVCVGCALLWSVAGCSDEDASTPSISDMGATDMGASGDKLDQGAACSVSLECQSSR